MAEVYGAPGTRPSDRDSKAARNQARADEKRNSHRHAQRETGIVIDAARAQRIQDALGGPDRLFEVLNAEVGPMTGDRVERLALDIIDTDMQGFTTGLKEWSQIQRAIERGIRAGYKLALDEEAGQ